MTDFILHKGPERKHRKKDLIRLMAARSDFSGAKHSCEQLLKLAPQPGADLNYPLTVAATVCYARPFTVNEPYGALPKKYERTLAAHQKIFHKQVLESRHKFFAHSDLDVRTAYIHPPDSVIAKMPIEMRSPKIGSSLTDRAFNSGFFENLEQISSHMLRVVKTDIDELLEQLYGSMDLPSSKFKLKIDNGM